MCMPAGSADIPATADDLTAYNSCTEANNGTASCIQAVRNFERATGCGFECERDRRAQAQRTEKFCRTASTAYQCRLVQAPCDVDAPATKPSRNADAGGADASGNVAGPRAIPSDSAVKQPKTKPPNASQKSDKDRARPDAPKGAEQSGSKRTAVIIACCLAGAALLLAIIAIIVVAARTLRRHKRKRKLAASPLTSSGSASSHIGAKMMRTNEAASPSLKRSVDVEKCAPAAAVKVTYSSHDGTLTTTAHVATAAAQPGCTGSVQDIVASILSSVTALSSPQEVLNAQLDYIEAVCDGMLTASEAHIRGASELFHMAARKHASCHA